VQAALSVMGRGREKGGLRERKMQGETNGLEKASEERAVWRENWVAGLFVW
jgi:hypothetical protein